MELLLGDCLDRLKDLEDNSIDAIVTDPPYGLSFMGKKWDYDVPSVDVWRECLRVLKPGGHLLSFAGTRTQHRMACNIEDAGFEIRDMIAWVYGSGFPKSLNIGKAVDKLQGNERIPAGRYTDPNGVEYKQTGHRKNFTAGNSGSVENCSDDRFLLTKGASEFEGWGTALKPALEPITVARKPLEKGLNVASNCLKWGVGGINIDGSRVECDLEREDLARGRLSNNDTTYFTKKNANIMNYPSNHGRFPANLIHDGSDEVVGLFPSPHGAGVKREIPSGVDNNYMGRGRDSGVRIGDSGSASRFFYCAKASKRERNIGCEGLEKRAGGSNAKGYTQDVARGLDRNRPVANFHPTVKPIALMEYLVKLVSREGQVVLDPFMGSGTTGMACKRLDREFVGIEMIPEYMEIAKCRIEGVKKREQLNMI